MRTFIESKREGQMKFAQKLRKERKKMGWTQQELADALDVSLRTITNYETGARYPKQRQLYYDMAEIFGVNVNYLLTEDESFVVQAGMQYGTRGAEQAQTLVRQVSGLFSGGELSETDKDAVMQALQQAYWDAKRENCKYTPKSYAEDKASDES